MFAVPAQAGVIFTNNKTSISANGLIDQHPAGFTDQFSEVSVYPKTDLPLIFSTSHSGEIFADSPATEVNSRAELDYEVTKPATNQWQLLGTLASSAEISESIGVGKVKSGSEVSVDIDFTLTSQYSYLIDLDFAVFSEDEYQEPFTFEHNFSKAELVYLSTGKTIFDISVDDDFSTILSGDLYAGDYQFSLNVYSEIFEDGSVFANLDTTVQLSEVPLPASLPLLLSGMVLLGLYRKTIISKG